MGSEVTKGLKPHRTDKAAGVPYGVDRPEDFGDADVLLNDGEGPVKDEAYAHR